LPYWTQGVITFHAPVNKISITPIVDYQVTHNKIKYTVFVRPGRKPRKSKIFQTTRRFKIRGRLKSSLLRGAFDKVGLRIGIDDEDRVSDVIIHADPKSL
jgi:hypothetical protein